MIIMDIIEFVLVLVLGVLSLLSGDFELGFLCLIVLRLIYIENLIKHRNYSDSDFNRGVRTGLFLADEKNWRIGNNKKK